jgi:hypothetical protein
MNRRSVVVGASVLALLFGALTLLGASPSPQKERPTAPGLGTAGSEESGGAPFEFSARRQDSGVITHIDAAGPYAYVTVRDDAGAVSVTATLGTTAEIGDRVERTLFGRRERFVSKRLNKTFAPLDFGRVEPFPAPSERSDSR